jgi:sec-independent protein translocase protein TatA
VRGPGRCYEKFMRLGFGEILLILVIVLVMFGPSKLPQLGDALGKGIRSFKKATFDPDPEEAAPEKSQPSPQGAGSPAPADGAKARR